MGKPVTTIVDRVWVVFGVICNRSFHNQIVVYKNDEHSRSLEEGGLA